jgi:hypothetical protein
MVRGCPFRIEAELEVSGTASVQRHKKREANAKDNEWNQKMAIGEDGGSLR